MAGTSDEDFAAKMLQIRGGKMKARNAKRLADAARLGEKEVYRKIKRAAQSHKTKLVFDRSDLSEGAVQSLKKNGYGLWWEDYTVRVSWNLPDEK